MLLVRWEKCLFRLLLLYTSLMRSVNAQALIKVERIKAGTDKLKFEGTCHGMFCENIKAFKVGLFKDCECRCGDATPTYVISKRRCLNTKSLRGNFTLSPRTFALTSTEFRRGKFIDYCQKDICRPSNACTVNMLSNSNAGPIDLWWSVHPSDVEVADMLTRSQIKLKPESKNYDGRLLKMYLTCQVDSKTITSFAIFAVTGEFDGPFTNPGLQSKQTSSSEDDMVTLIVAIILAVLLLISCIVLVFVYRRWRQAKKRNTNSNSEPPFSFAPTTPVFLVGNGPRTSKSQMPNIDIGSSNDNIYNSSIAGDQEKKVGTIKGLYTTIDKFLKNPSKKKPNGSLDEGYTTDDNYDYQRFSKELQPGSMISSFDEPDFKIPEDFHASVIMVDHIYPYAPHVHMDSVTKSDNTSQSSEPHYDSVQGDETVESPYDEVGTVISSGLSAEFESTPCPFESSNGTLLTSNTKLTGLKTHIKRISPYDECGRMILMNTRTNGQPIENDKTDIIDPYDQVGVVLINKLNGQKCNVDNPDDTLNGYDKVGQIVPSCEHHDDFHHQYDEPEQCVEQSTESVTDTKPVKAKPPRPPRPDSFDIITNRNACDEVRI